MESNKPLRTHPKMTKVLLGQIDSLDKAGHSVEDIAATLNTTPEAVQRGIDKLIDRRRSEIRATPGGAFTVAAQKKTVRAVCAEQSCPWRCDAKYYCVWPTCLKRRTRYLPAPWAVIQRPTMQCLVLSPKLGPVLKLKLKPRMFEKEDYELCLRTAV